MNLVQIRNEKAKTEARLQALQEKLKTLEKRNRNGKTRNQDSALRSATQTIRIGCIVETPEAEPLSEP